MDAKLEELDSNINTAIVPESWQCLAVILAQRDASRSEDTDVAPRQKRAGKRGRAARVHLSSRSASMKNRIILLLAATVWWWPCCTASRLHAAAMTLPEEQHQRIAAAFLLAAGREPSGEETDHWAQQGTLPIADIIARLGTQLAQDSAMQRAVIMKACHDALGRAPTDDEYRAWSVDKQATNYVELMQVHLETLRQDAAMYERVIQRVY